MKTTRYPGRDEWPELIRRPVQRLADVIDVVRPIADAVRRDGDAALRHYTRVFDRAAVDELAVPEAEIDGAGDRIDPSLRDAIDTARGNIERFHHTQLRDEPRVGVADGVECWRRRVPIARVGLYVPGGATPLFSTALMLGVPAAVAGCRDVIACTPPREDGTVDPAILYAARVTGIGRVFRVGGAQSIAAMARGTESVPRVDKIFGPGNQYVTGAKQLAAVDGVAIDLPAGPSEVLVIADGTADPDFVAADLLSQAEHGADSQVVLVTDDDALADTVAERIEYQLDRLPRREIASAALESARCVVVRDLAEGIEFANAYAPEHLILMTGDADDLAGRVTAAGSVFLGAWAPEAAGDYASGTNHTLPTNGYASAWSGVSVESFMKTITFQRISEDGLRELAPTVERMARGEGLDGHARAVRVRLDRAKVAAQ